MGGVTWDAPDADLKKLGRPDDVAVMAIAGTSAERRIMGEPIPGGFTGDIEILRICLGWLDPLTKAQRPALMAYIAQADSAVANNEAAILRVATALIVQTGVKRR